MMSSQKDLINHNLKMLIIIVLSVDNKLGCKMKQPIHVPQLEYKMLATIFVLYRRNDSRSYQRNQTDAKKNTLKKFMFERDLNP